MLLTVITINYNNAEGLKKTFESVFSQINGNFEYVVIDGGSTDGSKELIEAYQNHTHYWVCEKDNGIYHAMNKGIAAAKGEYVIFLNSGDEFFSTDITEKIMPELNGTDIISGDLNIIEADGRIWTNRNPETLTFRTLFQYTILHPCTFIRKKSFDTVGKYDESLKIVSDWKWFILAIAKHHLSYRKIPFIISTFRADGISSKPENREKFMEERKQTLHQEFPMFVEDYQHLYSYEQDSAMLGIINISRWTKLGKKLGFMKKVLQMEQHKKKMWE